MTRNVGIYLFDEVEVLDLGGPFEKEKGSMRLSTFSPKPLPLIPKEVNVID